MWALQESRRRGKEGEKICGSRTEDTDSRKRLGLETHGEGVLRRNSGVQTACDSSRTGL